MEFWPVCCRNEFVSKTHTTTTKDQEKCLSKVISGSIVPDFRPCMRCATSLVADKRVILYLYNIIQFNHLQSPLKDAQLESLSSSDLERIGFTCGAFDFISIVRQHNINGNKLLESIVTNPDHLSFLQQEWNKLLKVFGKLNIQGVPVKNDYHPLFSAHIPKPEVTKRLKQSGRIFGRLGRSSGAKGKSSGVLGKEKGKDGGRPLGSRTLVSLSIEQKFQIICDLELRLADQHATLHQEDVKHYAQTNWKHLVYDDINKKYNQSALSKITENCM